ncbi:sugar kinase [Nonomuraea sp. NPDC046570]|uniref:sugar kinase n=1 Tax=Nonomuraea sp. NPDC046570 TaxID=3155255 RepID=UPI0033FAAA6F
MAEVITFGEAMVLMYGERGLPLAEATSFTRSVAGAEANVSVGLARLGHDVAWFGRVGDDPFGRVVLNTLRGEGVDVSRARVDPDAPTGLLVRDCLAERRISVAYYRAGSAGSRLDAADVDHDWIGGAKLLHVTGITAALSESARQATHAAVAAAKAAGVPVCLDPNLRFKLASAERWRELIEELAVHADLVLTGDEETSVIAGEEGERWFFERGAGLVVTKLGARGAKATDGRSSWEVPVWPVTAVDSVGAGDAFAAGFLSGWLRELPVPEALRVGARVAAFVVGTPGDQSGLPYLSEISGGADVDR